MKEVRKQLLEDICENAKAKQVYFEFIDRDMEYIHCLFASDIDMTAAKVLQLIKREAAHWVNKNSLIKLKLEWTGEYSAVSVSESMLDKVRDDIRYQEEYHKRTTFKEEYAKFMNQYGYCKHG